MFKKLFYLSLLLVLLCITSTSKADLVAYYSFDEGAGNLAADGSGNSYDGVPEGSLNFVWVEGINGTALRFAGSGAPVYCGTFDPSEETDQFTISCWVNWEGADGNYQGIISKRDGYVEGDVRFNLETSNTAAGGGAANLSFTLTATNTRIWSAYSPPEGEWDMVTVTYDGTNATMYVNGVQQGNPTALAFNNGEGTAVYIGTANADGGSPFNGAIDEVYMFSTALTEDEITQLMNHELKPAVSASGLAKKPNPANKSTDNPIEIELSWIPGEFVATDGGTHNIYFGTDLNDVNEATVDDQRGVLVSQGQAADANSYDPGMLDFGTTYYWRIDEVNATNPGTNVGKVWSFTTEPVALNMPFENITVTVRNRSNTTDPNNTANGYGLDPNHPDQHANNLGSWYTTIPDANGTWIQYEFNKEYKLQDLLVWNYNHKILKFYGMKKVRIDYSLDGENWTEFTDVNEFNQATGSDAYVYNTIVPFNGIVAKFVRITGLQSYNSGASIGLSEVRFTYIPVRARLPYPADESTNITLDTVLSWRKGREGTSHKVLMSTDANSVTNGTAPSHTSPDGRSYSPVLNLGTNYYWRVDAINNSMDPSVWSTDTWSFSTIEYITVDDFEDYNDEPGYEVWNTWWDGFETAGNGSQMGHNPPPYCETTIVAPGSDQSAPVYYSNLATGSDKADNSEVEREFATAQNWTTNGADTLRLYYRGQAAKYSNPSPGVFAFGGEGADIWGTSDQFRFVYKELTGNGSIVARVDSLQNTNTWAKAGVMVRNTLDANSVHAMAILNAIGNGSFQRRVKKGETSAGTDYAGLGFPYWVKVTRTGNKINAYHSEDGVTWVSFEADPNNESTVTIETPGLANKIYIGLAVTSHTADVLAGATFSGVATTGTVSSQWTVAAIGDEDQAEGDNSLDNLYVALEDSTGTRKKVFAPETAVGTARWTEWVIPYSDFAGVNMSKIRFMAIGIGDTANPLNGEGLIYIDNIGIGHSLGE